MRPEDLEARLSRLERDNRRLRRTLAALVVAASAPLLLAYVPANDRIEAAELVVRDKGGAVRARVWVDEKGKTRLTLRDQDGKSAVMLASGDGASLSLGDKEGKSSVVLSAASASKGVLVLENDGQPKAVLSKPKGFDSLDPLDWQDPWATPE
ncbi:MAG: hypothetical protein HYV09_16415 [Deltaproteobacteria bacterium]|nr:hypothetical protein [Deltaproteobacteria bacterium]